nr:hypothetical protein [Tanacetum cinerariifolium]
MNIFITLNLLKGSNAGKFIELYEKLVPTATEADAPLDQNDQADQNDHTDLNDLNDQNDHHVQADEILNNDQPKHSNQNSGNHINDNLPNTKDILITKPLSSPIKNTLAPSAVSSIQTESPSSIPSMASPAPQYRESKDKHIKLVNIIDNLRARMLTNMANDDAIRKRASSTRGQASSSREETMEEKVRKFRLFDYKDHQMNYDNLVGRSIHLGDVVDWEFLSNKVLLSHSSTPSILIPSLGHNGLTFSKSISPSFTSLLGNFLPRLSLMPLLIEEMIDVLNREPPPHITGRDHRSGKRDGWTNKSTNGGGSMPGWNNKTKGTPHDDSEKVAYDRFREVSSVIFELSELKAPRSPEYVPDPIELEDHVPAYIPEHPEDLLPTEDEAPIEAYILKVVSTPTPPLPPSFLSLRIRPLHTRAAMAQMRATVPSTYHSLLSSGTPPLLPIPLPVPSTSRRAEIPEADTPPRKRLLLTAPRPRCKVGESSDAAAARQPGPTMARSVDCSFADIMETRFRDTERRMMTALEMVNMRVSYQVDVRSRESSEFYSRHHNAQEDRAAVRAEIEKMAPKRTTRSTKVPPVTPAPTATTTTVTEAQLQNLINQGVAAAIAEEEASRVRNGYDSNSSGPRLAQVVRECTYPDFLKCQPLNFKGTEGVVGLTQWFEKMESVFNISNCTATCQVKYAACTLQGVALTWWNSHVKTVTLEVAQALLWKTLKKMMTDKYCPRGEIKKLETEMWELKTKGTNVIGYSRHF